MAIKAGQQLVSLGPQASSQVMTHPAQRMTFGRIVQLIDQLRALEQPTDFYEFQRRLFDLLYQVEERRGQCSRMIKRLQRGCGVPKDAPPPPHSGDPTEKANWELEAYVYERLARQLRTVGDGFAWRCFGYNRQVIQTLSRNDSAGLMYGKIGLPYELERIRELCPLSQAQQAVTAGDGITHRIVVTTPAAYPVKQIDARIAHQTNPGLGILPAGWAFGRSITENGQVRYTCSAHVPQQVINAAPIVRFTDRNGNLYYSYLGYMRRFGQNTDWVGAATQLDQWIRTGPKPDEPDA